MAVGHLNRTVEVGENVAHVLNANRQAYQLGGNPGIALLLNAKLRMGGGCGVDDQRFSVTDIRQQREQLEGVDELLARLESALDAEGDQRALAVRQVFLRPRVVLAGRKPRDS